MGLLDADTLLGLRHLVRARRAEGTTTLPGGIVIRPRGRGLETADLAPFAEGDDPRHVDAAATARRGGVPHVRRFHAERDRTVLLIADFRPVMLWGTRRVLRSVAAAEALCLAGWAAVEDGARTGLIAVGAGPPVYRLPRGRLPGMARVIGGLVAQHAEAERRAGEPDPPLDTVLQMASRLAPRGAEIVLASSFDAPGPGFADAARRLAARTSLRFLRIMDAFERSPPPGRYRVSTADGRVRTVTLGTGHAGPGAGPGLPAGVPVETYQSMHAPDANV